MAEPTDGLLLFPRVLTISESVVFTLARHRIMTIVEKEFLYSAVKRMIDDIERWQAERPCKGT